MTNNSSNYRPPPMPVVGSRLHDSIIASLNARGVDVTRESYLAAAREERVDPMNRPLSEAQQTPWALRRARDNASGEMAAALLRREGKELTRESYLDAVDRVQERVGSRYRDDVPGMEGNR